MGDKPSFPAESDVQGRLLLSGADALGPNPWTTPAPGPATFGLTSDEMNDATLAEAGHETLRELRSFPYRFLSAFLVPAAGLVATWFVVNGSFELVATPSVEWVAYAGASALLAAVGAHLQTLHFEGAKMARALQMSAGDRRAALASARHSWRDEQERRTRASFWTDEIRRIAAEKNVAPGHVFAQEVAKLFVAWGWLVKLNQRAHDYGVDVFTTGKEGSAVIQCKHAMNAGPEAAEIRDLAGSRHAFNADYGLMISIQPPSATRQNQFFSDKGQLEFWHLGHILEQCAVLYRQRTGEDAPWDEGSAGFLNPDGTPVSWDTGERDAAE